MIRRLENLRKKKAQLLSSLTFLCRCRQAEITPMFLRSKRTIKSAQAHRIFNRMEKALLRERIHFTRHNLAIVDKELLLLNLKLANSMHFEDWDKIDRLSYRTMEATKDQATKRQINKFDKLITKQTAKSSSDMSRTVINLSKRELATEELSVLSKGGNFAISPASVPVEDIIANVESGIRSLQEDVAEEIRTESARILRRAKPPKSNISAKERRAIRDLNKDETILVLPADKGNATVVMNTNDYEEKIRDLLDPNTYRKLGRDPTTTILRKTNSLIRNSSIEPENQQKLRRSEALPPRLYGLPKIHKTDVPLRPIVSAIGSPTYSLAKYLTTLLDPLIGRTESYIKDSTHFIDKIKDITVTPDDILVSFDVVSLFTMVPVKEAMSLIGSQFPPDITELFRHCLSTTYFQWNQDFYEQVDGVAMGSPLSPCVANFFMEDFELKALNTTTKKPKCWFRYVDDTFVIWSHGVTELKTFLTHINSINDKIQFTMETEKDGKLAFLDVQVERRPDGNLGHKVYRKPTHTDRYLNKGSNHHPRQKLGVIKTLATRAARICEPRHLKHEMDYLSCALKNNGYSSADIKNATKIRTKREQVDEPKGKATLPYINSVTDRIGKLLERHNVRVIYKPTTTIKQSLKSAKDKRDPLATAGVYRIPCSCGSVYVGTTKRSINTRITEHKRSCRLGQTDKSAVAEHTLTKDNHQILFEDTQVLDKTSFFYPRLFREAIEIQKHSNNFNRKEEGLRISKTWTQVINKTKTLPRRRLMRPTSEATPTSERINTTDLPLDEPVIGQQLGRSLRPLPHRTS